MFRLEKMCRHGTALHLSCSKNRPLDTSRGFSETTPLGPQLCGAGARISPICESNGLFSLVGGMIVSLTIFFGSFTEGEARATRVGPNLG